MFYWIYIRRELRRRMGRTVLTATGLAVGVAMVVAITAVSNGLDDAQATVLDPLSSVGTDLIVTRPVSVQNATTAQPGAGTATPQFGIGGRGPGGVVQLDDADQQALRQETSAVLTDLATLGNPGDQFEHDFFLASTNFTFAATQADTVSKVEGVQSVAEALTLQVQHQKGTVPEIVATFQTGGQTFDVAPTDEERAAIQACLQANGVTGGGPGAGGGGPGAGPGGGNADAIRNCLPNRRFTTPQQTITQLLNPPSTDITTTSYTIGGVDLTKSGIGLITPAQIVSGTFFSTDAAHEAVLSAAYADKQGLKVGDTITLNDVTYDVVGLADPPLSGEASDVYLSLSDLQTLSNRMGRVNVLLVRAVDSSKVAEVSKAIEAAFPGSTVTSAEDLASSISGSLVDANDIVGQFGSVIAIVVLITAFALAALLTLSSVAKRVRELGTLKAIGWRQHLVVRQIVGESAVVGVLGGVLGAVVGIGAAALAAGLMPELEASTSTASGGLFGVGAVTRVTSNSISLTAPVHLSLLVGALALAVVGGLVAGTVGALRAARLRPADALRELG